MRRILIRFVDTNNEIVKLALQSTDETETNDVGGSPSSDLSSIDKPHAPSMLDILRVQ